MSFSIIGKIDHYVSGDGSVSFSFREKKKPKKDEVAEEYDWNTTNIPFIIWQKFKNNDVEITIKKA